MELAGKTHQTRPDQTNQPPVYQVYQDIKLNPKEFYPRLCCVFILVDVTLRKLVVIQYVTWQNYNHPLCPIMEVISLEDV